MPRKRNFDLNPVYYIYILFDWCGIPRYVGKGKGRRVFSHELNTDDFNMLKNEFIEQTWIMLKEIPKIFVRERITEEQAFQTEIALIKALGRMDLGTGPLVNMTNGGDGFIGGRKYSERRRKEQGELLRRINARYSKEELSERAKAVHARRSEEERKATGQKTWKTRHQNNALIDPEELAKKRHASALKREANLTAEQKSARGKASWVELTPEQRSERGKAGNANLTPEQLSHLADRLNAGLTFEQRSERLKTAFATKLTPEERSERSRSGGKATMAKLSSEEKTERSLNAIQAWMDKTTPEERSASRKKSWETRRKNKLNRD